MCHFLACLIQASRGWLIAKVGPLFKDWFTAERFLFAT